MIAEQVTLVRNGSTKRIVEEHHAYGTARLLVEDRGR
jgi:hypothetical protein